MSGGIQWKKSLYQEYEEKADEIEKHKQKKLKKQRRAAKKQQALKEHEESG